MQLTHLTTAVLAVLGLARAAAVGKGGDWDAGGAGRERSPSAQHGRRHRHRRHREDTPCPPCPQDAGCPADLSVCTTRIGNYTMMTRPVPWLQAQAACARFGLQLAAVTTPSFLAATQVAFGCSGAFSESYVGSWDGNAYGGRPLVLATGSAAPGGTIVEVADGEVPRNVLCQLASDQPCGAVQPVAASVTPACPRPCPPPRPRPCDRSHDDHKPCPVPRPCRLACRTPQVIIPKTKCVRCFCRRRVDCPGRRRRRSSTGRTRSTTRSTTTTPLLVSLRPPVLSTESQVTVGPNLPSTLLVTALTSTSAPTSSSALALPTVPAASTSTAPPRARPSSTRAPGRTTSTAAATSAVGKLDSALIALQKWMFLGSPEKANGVDAAEGDEGDEDEGMDGDDDGADEDEDGADNDDGDNGEGYSDDEDGEKFNVAMDGDMDESKALPFPAESCGSECVCYACHEFVNRLPQHQHHHCDDCDMKAE